MILWVLGTILNVFGSVLVNLAANLLKLAHNVAVKEQDPELKKEQEGSTGWLAEALKCSFISRTCLPSYRFSISYSKLYWRIGAFLFALGSVINFLSLSMASQSLLATLGGVQFVSNLFFARFILGEIITRKGILASTVIVLGLTVAISFSDHSSKTYTTTELFALYDFTYITFIVCVIALLGLAEFVYVFYTSREKNGRSMPYSVVVRPVAYSIVSSTVGTQSVLQSKCLAELLKTDIVFDRSRGNDLFSNGLFYVVLTAFLLGMAFWLYRLNNALKMFDGLVIIPILQVFWVTSAVLQGGVFFKEFEEMSKTQGTFFGLGVITVFIGVYLTATSQDKDMDVKSYIHNDDVNYDRLADPEPTSQTRGRTVSVSDAMIVSGMGSPFRLQDYHPKARNFNDETMIEMTCRGEVEESEVEESDNNWDCMSSISIVVGESSTLLPSPQKTSSKSPIPSPPIPLN